MGLMSCGHFEQYFLPAQSQAFVSVYLAFFFSRAYQIPALTIVCERWPIPRPYREPATPITATSPSAV